MRTTRAVIAMMALWWALPASAEVIVRWDFSTGLHGWKGNAYVVDLLQTHDGLSFRSTGIDPWIEGPAIDLPREGLIKVSVHMKSDANGSGELFYGPTFQAGHSVRFTVNNDDRWHDYKLFILETPGRGTRFRLDPATAPGHISVAFIEVESLVVPNDPPYEAPGRPVRSRGRAGTVDSGSLALEYLGTGLGEFIVTVSGREMAVGYDRELIGVLLDDAIEWLDLSDATVSVNRDGDGASLTAHLTDAKGGRWQIRRTVCPGEIEPALSVETQIEVDADREVMCLPALTIFPGLDTFGQAKTQGLLAGLEYLGDEPSSNQADITTPEHIRRVPDPVKVTFPLMAIAAQGRYLGLIWEPSEWIGPMFDSPDTVFGSNAHVMSLTGPAVGQRRFENHLVAHTPIHLAAHVPITARMWIIGGEGDTIVPAVRQYVQLRGLPPVPRIEGGLQSAARLLAHGWVRSKIREGGLFRHAVWSDRFAAGPAPDAAMFMDWLAVSLDVSDAELITELLMTRDLALSEVPETRHLDGGVSHVRPPAAPLLFGDLQAYVQRRHAAAARLERFDLDGVKPYKPGDVDYGTTHFADHANGYGAADLGSLLEGAALSGDAGLIDAALELLDKQTLLYANTVPRGAQTWEIPLHTPDILASGHLAKAYTLGYILSGREDHLDQARYWAWTGVPFVYLANPTQGEIGPYATIPVLGATNWKGSWFGRPVQWCGLVYASALHLLGRYDSEGPWSHIARGITAAGLQMAWPTDDADRQGLLPDFFLLESQHRDGPAINPGTTQATVAELFDVGTLYDVRRLPTTGCFIHAPCRVHDVAEEEQAVSFVVDGWGAGQATGPYHVLVSGWQGARPYVTTCEHRAQADDAPEWSLAETVLAPGSDLLVIRLNGPAQVHINARLR